MFEISERAHAGLQLMAALAALKANERLSLKSIAEDESLSLAYLEEIASALRAARLIEGRQGPGGGYRLTRPPGRITLEQISTALEGRVILVDCQNPALVCPHKHKCRTKHLWHHLQKTIQTQLLTLTLKDVYDPHTNQPHLPRPRRHDPT